MKLSKALYSGCGNLFLIQDNRQTGGCPQTAGIVSICLQHQVDGLIFWEESAMADARMRIFNADGSEAEMCGNGIRCLFHFMRQCGYSKQQALIETLAGILPVEEHGDLIRVQMGPATDIHWNLLVPPFVIHSLNTGVPHAVLFVPDVAAAPVLDLGKKIRYHEKFSPKGSNVNFVEIISSQKIRVRTYERGVEGETQACGTGATAAAYAAGHILKMKPPIHVEVRSGENLLIDWDAQRLLSMSGPAKLERTLITC